MRLLVDVIVIGAAGELLVLAILHRRGRAPALMANLAAGLALLLALRTALAGDPDLWIALCLTAALVAHVADLRRRWRERPADGNFPR